MAIVVTSVRSSVLSCLFSALWIKQVEPVNSALCLGSNFSTRRGFQLGKPLAYPYLNNAQISSSSRVYFSSDSDRAKRTTPTLNAVGKNLGKRSRKKQHHLWQRKDTAGSGQKAFNLVRIVSELPNEKAAVYGALDKWIAWELEFPLVASAKGLQILKKRSQWARVIQVAKWMLSKGQGATMATYDTLLLAFDMEQRLDEAESLWNMILHTHTRSISKRLFSRMIALYNHHHKPDKIIEVFADMEELGVKPDEDTVRRISRAFQELGQEDKKKMVLKRYGLKWKYIHFNGERVRVKVDHSEDE